VQVRVGFDEAHEGVELGAFAALHEALELVGAVVAEVAPVESP